MKTDYKKGDWIAFQGTNYRSKAYLVTEILGNNCYRSSCGGMRNNQNGDYELATPKEIIKAGGISNNLITFNYLIL